MTITVLQLLYVWGAVTAGYIIGPNPFEVNNVNVTANSEHYPDMLQNFLIPKLQRRDVQ
jgi:hypothetical protein